MRGTETNAGHYAGKGFILLLEVDSMKKLEAKSYFYKMVESRKTGKI